MRLAWLCTAGAVCAIISLLFQKVVTAANGHTVYGLRGILLGLWCFWALVTQQPRPEPAPRGTLRWRRGLLAPGDGARLLTRLHREPPAAAVRGDTAARPPDGRGRAAQGRAAAGP